MRDVGTPVKNTKRVYRIMTQNAMLPERKPAIRPLKRANKEKAAARESNPQWFRVPL